MRRLGVLVEQVCLRAGSCTAVAIHGDAGRWTHTDYILAAIADPHYRSGYPRPKDKVKQARLRAMATRWKNRHRKGGDDG